MILNPKRRAATRFGAFCGLAAAMCLLALTCVLSLGTLRPLSAEEERPARAASDAQPARAVAEARADSAAVEPRDAPVITEKTATVLEETEVGGETNEPVITLKVALLVRDFDRVGYDAIKALAHLDRVSYRGQGTERTALKAELDESSAETALLKLQALEGVRTLCKSTIIALSGQRAVIEVSEPGPRVEVEEGRGARVYSNPKQDILHRIAITSRTTTDPNRLDVTVYGGWLKLPVGVGKTLMLVNTGENDILLLCRKPLASD